MLSALFLLPFLNPPVPGASTGAVKEMSEEFHPPSRSTALPTPGDGKIIRTYHFSVPDNSYVRMIYP
jgi:hypothetical protein